MVNVSTPLRIVIADGQPMFRDGLKLLLQEKRDLLVVGDTGTASDAPWLVDRRNANLLLIDVAMPGAIAALGHLPQSAVKTIAVVAEEDRDPLIAALDRVDGVVLKESEVDLLFSTIDSVAADGVAARRERSLFDRLFAAVWSR